MSKERARRLQDALDLRGRRKRYAVACEIGVNPSSLTRWLQGDPISIEHAIRLCLLLDISLDWLLLGRGAPEPTMTQGLTAAEQRLLETCRMLRPEVPELLIGLLEAAKAKPPLLQGGS